ncbi:30S ribosomal protein 3-1, chloroplastic [Linum grandiflorum]
MLPAAIQAGANPIFISSSLLSSNSPTSKVFIPAFPKPCLPIHSPTTLLHRSIGQPRGGNRRFSPLAPVEAVATLEEGLLQMNEVVVKQMENPRVVLKFIWMEKNIGLGIDQVIPGQGTVPLSPYFFWPRKDAWEELKTALESKPWISQKKMIILLNQATDIINLWQQSGGNFTA